MIMGAGLGSAAMAGMPLRKNQDKVQENQGVKLFLKGYMAGLILGFMGIVASFAGNGG